jgi:hypothetical protein
LEPTLRLVGLGLDACALDVDRAQPLPGLRGGPACVDLLGPEPAKLVRQRCGPRRARIGAGAKPRLERIVGDTFQRLDEPSREARNGHGDGIACRGVRLLGNRCRRARLELVDLGGESAATRLELQPHRLGGFAGEPELATVRVVTEALGSDRGNRRVQELFLRDDRKLVDEGGRITRQHDDVAQTGRTRTFRQCECRPRVAGDERRRAVSERRGDRPLAARLDVEQRERQPLPLLGKRPCSGRKSLALGERTLECLQTLASESRLLTQRLAFGAHAGVENAARPRQLCAQALEQGLGALATELQPFTGAAQAVERRRCFLAPAGRVRQLLLRTAALLQQRVETFVGVLARENRGSAPPLSLLEPLVEIGEVQLGNARTQRGDLSEELLRAFGRGRLERERPEPLLHLRLDVTRPLDLDGHARKLQLSAVLAPLELAKPGRLLEELAALFGLRGEDLLDAALADDRVHAAAEAEIGEELDEVDPTHGRAVEQVLALAAAMEPAGDRELGVGQRAVAVRVVEQQLDLAEVVGRPAAAAGEEHVVGLLGPQLGGRERPGRPDDRVRHVRLARAVRAHHHGHARLEANLDRIRERLEAAQLDRAKVHAQGG